MPATRNWKQELRFLAIGEDACPNHEPLADFKKLSKVTIERGHTFGLTALMKDHLLRGFKKGRDTEDLDQLPVIQFVNRIAFA
jgi:hypothetical protein